MLVKQHGKIFYFTRKIYGTNIELFLTYENNVLKKVSFTPQKLRDDISIPETKEDKKVYLVISAIKELMKTEGINELTAVIYDGEVEFVSTDTEEFMFDKILHSIIDTLSTSSKIKVGVVDNIKDLLREALKNGRIDVF